MRHFVSRVVALLLVFCVSAEPVAPAFSISNEKLGARCALAVQLAFFQEQALITALPYFLHPFQKIQAAWARTTRPIVSEYPNATAAATAVVVFMTLDAVWRVASGHGLIDFMAGAAPQASLQTVCAMTGGLTIQSGHNEEESLGTKLGALLALLLEARNVLEQAWTQSVSDRSHRRRFTGMQQWDNAVRELDFTIKKVQDALSHPHVAQSLSESLAVDERGVPMGWFRQTLAEECFLRVVDAKERADRQRAGENLSDIIRLDQSEDAPVIYTGAGAPDDNSEDAVSHHVEVIIASILTMLETNAHAFDSKRQVAELRGQSDIKWGELARGQEADYFRRIRNRLVNAGHDQGLVVYAHDPKIYRPMKMPLHSRLGDKITEIWIEREGPEFSPSTSARVYVLICDRRPNQDYPLKPAEQPKDKKYRNIRSAA